MDKAELATAALFEAIGRGFEGDMVLTIRAVAPDRVCGEPQVIVQMGHGFGWWVRCTDESAEQFRRRAIAAALRPPPIHGNEFGHVRVIAELPYVPEGFGP